MTVPLDDTARRLLDAKTFATVATLNPDGSPQTSVVWVKREGDVAVFTTTKQRKKGRNLHARPAASASRSSTPRIPTRTSRSAAAPSSPTTRPTRSATSSRRSTWAWIRRRIRTGPSACRSA